MSSGAKYWAERALECEAEVSRSARITIDYVAGAYDRLMGDINRDIKRLVGIFSGDNDLTRAEAMQILTAKEKAQNVAEMIAQVKTMRDRVKRQQLIREIQALAVKSRITRLEMLKQQIYISSLQFADVEIGAVTSLLGSVITTSYYKGIYDVSKYAGVAVNFSRLSERTIRIMLANKWQDKNYSQRIWGHNESFAQRVRAIVQDGITRGKSQERITHELAEALNVAKSNAARLVRTETNYFNNQATLMKFRELGFKKYRFVATLDMRTSEICSGLDGEIYDVDKAEVGKNFPPMHPHCRSVPVQADYESGESTRIARNEHGKPIKVPKNIKYPEWKEKFIDKPKENAYNKSVKNIREKINNEYDLKINAQKQERHIEGAAGYKAGRSILTADAQKLLNQHAGKGYPKLTQAGEWSRKEWFEHNSTIGYWVNSKGEKIATNKGSIHYSSTGEHIVPANPKGVKPYER